MFFHFPIPKKNQNEKAYYEVTGYGKHVRGRQPCVHVVRNKKNVFRIELSLTDDWEELEDMDTAGDYLTVIPYN